MGELAYTTIDKAAWGDGPWQDEPDKVQWKDEATGLPCLAKRHEFYGNWCGYVGVSEGHPHFLAEDTCELDLEVHGGITYGATCQEGPEATSICHVPGPGEPDHVFWLGFDCGHAWDMQPGLIASYGERFARDGNPIWLAVREGVEYRTLEYVRAECARLAAQLAA